LPVAATSDAADASVLYPQDEAGTRGLFAGNAFSREDAAWLADAAAIP